MTSTRPGTPEDRATGRRFAPVPRDTTAAHSTWQVVGRLLAFIGLMVVAVVLVPAVLYPLQRIVNAAIGARVLNVELMNCVALLVATAVSLRIFRESWSVTTRLGVDALGRWPLLGGAAAGWFAMSIPAGLLIWIGALNIVPANAGDWWDGAAQALAILAPAALAEEVVLRGYAFTLIRRRWGVLAAVASTSVVFASLHLFNPGVTVQAVVNVTLAGGFLAVVLLAFNSLWAAWLAHLAYNFVQVAVFHTAVSGIAVPQPNYRTVSTGPAWLSGGDWGPEAGAAAALGMLGVSFLLAIYAGWIGVQRRGWRLEVEWRLTGRKES